MAQFYFTGAHLTFLEGRGLIFIKMRQISTKVKLQILQNTIKLKCIPNISYIILILAENKTKCSRVCLEFNQSSLLIDEQLLIIVRD